MSNVTSNSPLIVNFTDDSLNFPISWNWSFGDGNYSTSKNVTYIYYYTGNYTVILNVTNAAGSNTTTKYANSTQNIPPIASFTMSNTSSPSPLVVQFNDTSINFPTAWNWSFGNGVYSNDKDPIYIFTGQGNYTVTLNASNFIGNGYTSH